MKEFKFSEDDRVRVQDIGPGTVIYVDPFDDVLPYKVKIDGSTSYLVWWCPESDLEPEKLPDEKYFSGPLSVEPISLSQVPIVQAHTQSVAEAPENYHSHTSYNEGYDAGVLDTKHVYEDAEIKIWSVKITHYYDGSATGFGVKYFRTEEEASTFVSLSGQRDILDRQLNTSAVPPYTHHFTYYDIEEITL